MGKKFKIVNKILICILLVKEKEKKGVKIFLKEWYEKIVLLNFVFVLKNIKEN